MHPTPYLGGVVDGVAEGEESVGGQADPGQLSQEGVLFLGRQGFRHRVEVRLPRQPLRRRDVTLDVPATRIDNMKGKTAKENSQKLKRQS